jgi:hypothetical protein
MKKKKKTASLPRRKWTRSPVQKPHSTAKGKRGYRRPRERKRLRSEAEEG